MPHKCVRCGKTLENGSPELAKGCECGSRIFLYLRSTPSINVPRKQAAPEQTIPIEIKTPSLQWLEEKLQSLTAEQPVSIEPEAVENIRMLGQGTYEIDLKSIMGGNPIVIKTHNGVYFIKMPASKTIPQ
ncbi:hypothetical protein AUJ65_01360 [Candidatus Micrarchaeota archaeon CG1_02_51_15]|nr:MAG: hypothetical protein AUJ65_01360 [Candidatus Micrarchaeota archaeon CG1_02_51_15]